MHSIDSSDSSNLLGLCQFCRLLSGYTTCTFPLFIVTSSPVSSIRNWVIYDTAAKSIVLPLSGIRSGGPGG